MQSLKITSFRISYTSTILGAIVTGAVYSSILISGEVVSYLAGSCIQIMSSILGYTTELIIGNDSGEIIRNVGKYYGSLAKPAIITIYRLSAISISVAMGASTAVTTSLFTYTTKKAIRFIFSMIKDYNKYVLNKNNNLMAMNEKGSKDNKDRINHINYTNNQSPMGNTITSLSKNTLLENFRLLLEDKQLLMLKDSVIK